ncbi:MAG: heat shock protein 70 family, partial [Piptocephalis tieghemiana]
MSVVGIDFGNLSTVVAVARNRGIDVICNEVSNRVTPTLVSFGQKQRYLGEGAKTQETSNLKNTVGSLKRLAGRTLSEDKELSEVEARFLTVALTEVDQGAEVSVKVQYRGEPRTFTITQVIAMYFTKIKAITAAEINGPVTDCVISIPGYYTDRQRRAILDAAEIAGLNPLRLLNDVTAAALGYGITKTDLPEEKPRHVVFVDIGHSDYGVAVVNYLKGQLTVKATAYDRHFGGRYFDEVLVDHFAADFKERYKIDVKSNAKALLRLRVGCEKLKKVLSANPQAHLNVESIMDDRDVSALMTRQEFEELASDLFSRVRAPIEKALADAGLTAEEIDAIEIVGGSTRIPAIKDTLTDIFKKELSTTLNQDEAIARGCALQCAILSPVFKVRDFSIQDITPYPVKYSWEASGEETESELEVFPRNNTIPSTKVLTLSRDEPFDLTVDYADPSTLPPGTRPHLGRYTVQKVKPMKSEETGEMGPATVKVKARVNMHGIASVDGAYIAEEITKEETDEDGNTKTRKVIRKHELPIVASNTSSLPLPILQGLTEAEGQMAAEDKLVADTEERKNALEEYVYEMRDRVETIYKDFVDEATGASFLDQLRSTEDWLYEDGEDASKSIYVSKLNELRAIGDPIVSRAKEAEGREEAIKALRSSIDIYTAQATDMGDSKYDHIPVEEKQKVAERCGSTLKWLEEKVAEQEAKPAHEDPILRVAELKKERQDLVMFASGIMSKPKPAP